ncbi:MAG: hypothetical protein M3Q71_19135 [Chloroflexota bacterium]|nr:hypothetical protein [Chloroflexota bacterium]
MTDIGPSGSAAADFLHSALGDAALASAGAALPAVPVPWDLLARVPGWAVWLGHPPVPPDLPILPVAEEFVWGDPLVALATATIVSVDYAVRRARVYFTDIADLLRREAPVVVIVPGDVHPSLLQAIDDAERVGLPIVRGVGNVPAVLASLPSFAARQAAHAGGVKRPHDPALSLQTIEVAGRIGGNPLSSFVLHHEGERDGVSVIGDFSARFGVEVGVMSPAVGLEETANLEAMAATYPSFQDGVTSRIEGHSLEVSWANGYEPNARDLGEVIRAWLKALHGLRLVDVRIAFAPPQGRSALLTDMRARAAAFKAIRSGGQGSSS